MTASHPIGIAETLRAIVAQRLEIAPGKVPMDASILGDLGLESIEVMEFMLEIEERFPSFDFSDPQVSHLKTLRELSNWLEGVVLDSRSAGDPESVTV